MSIAKSGVLENLTGSLGNVIIYKVKGQIRVRSKGGFYKKSKSKLQKNQKSKFKHVASYYSKLGSPMCEIWTEATKDLVMSGYNLFIKENIHNISPEGEVIDMNRCKICYGDLPLPAELRMTQLTADKVLVEWQDSESQDKCWSNDLLQIAIYDPNKKSDTQIYWLKEVVAERSAGRCEFALPDKRGKQIYLFAYFRSEFWTKFSESFYLGEVKDES